MWILRALSILFFLSAFLQWPSPRMLVAVASDAQAEEETSWRIWGHSGVTLNGKPRQFAGNRIPRISEARLRTNSRSDVWIELERAWQIRMHRNTRMAIVPDGSSDTIRLEEGHIRLSTFRQEQYPEGWQKRRYADRVVLMSSDFAVLPEVNSHLVAEVGMQAQVTVLSGQAVVEDLNTGKLFNLSTGDVWRKDGKSGRRQKQRKHRLDMKDIKKNLFQSPEYRRLREQQIEVSDVEKALENGAALESLYLSQLAISQRRGRKEEAEPFRCLRGYALFALDRRKLAIKLWKSSLERSEGSWLCRLALAEYAFRENQHELTEKLLEAGAHPPDHLRSRVHLLLGQARSRMNKHIQATRDFTLSLWEGDLNATRQARAAQELNRSRLEKSSSLNASLGYQFDGNPLALHDRERSEQSAVLTANRILGSARAETLLTGNRSSGMSVAADLGAAFHLEEELQSVNLLSVAGFAIWHAHLFGSPAEAPLGLAASFLASKFSDISLQSRLVFPRLSWSLELTFAELSAVPLALDLRQSFTYGIATLATPTVERHWGARIEQNVRLSEEFDLGQQNPIPRFEAQLNTRLVLGHGPRRAFTLSAPLSLKSDSWVLSEAEDDAAAEPSLNLLCSFGGRLDASLSLDPWWSLFFSAGYLEYVPLGETEESGYARPDARIISVFHF